MAAAGLVATQDAKQSSSRLRRGGGPFSLQRMRQLRPAPAHSSRGGGNQLLGRVRVPAQEGRTVALVSPHARRLRPSAAAKS